MERADRAFAITIRQLRILLHRENKDEDEDENKEMNY